MSARHTLGELAVRFGLTLRGDPDVSVDRLSTLAHAGPGTLSFLANSRYRKQLEDTLATAVLVSPADAAHCRVAALIGNHPYLSYARIAQLLHPDELPVAGVHASATVAADARIAASARIEAQVVIGEGVHIGERVSVGAGSVIESGCRIDADTRLAPRVTLYAGVSIGRRCLLHAGVVVGADGFGFAPDAGVWVKIPQVGSVRIGDDVEIGANTTIDRGAIEDTIVEEGVKLDNQIQVGHNCIIGAHTAVAGCTGISGSTVIGKRCRIGGGVGIAGQLSIADDVVLTGYSLVTSSITEAGSYSSGMPTVETRRWRRMVASLRRLADKER